MAAHMSHVSCSCLAVLIAMLSPEQPAACSNMSSLPGTVIATRE